MNEEHNKKHCFWKYLGLFFATLVGAFLAVYFVTDLAISRMMDPMVAMHRMDREFEKMNKDMMFVKEIPPHHMKGKWRHHKHHNTIDFFRTPDEYKFIIDLKPFNNNPDNIKITTNDSSITLSGEATVDKRHSETFTSFSQTYSLDKDANLEKMTKRKVDDKYIITIPLDDDKD